MPARFIPHVSHGVARASVYFFVFIQYGSYITALGQVKNVCVRVEHVLAGSVDGLLELVRLGFRLIIGRAQLRYVLLMQSRVRVSRAIDRQLDILGGLVRLATHWAQPGE